MSKIIEIVAGIGLGIVVIAYLVRITWDTLKEIFTGKE